MNNLFLSSCARFLCGIFIISLPKHLSPKHERQFKHESNTKCNNISGVKGEASINQNHHYRISHNNIEKKNGEIGERLKTFNSLSM